MFLNRYIGSYCHKYQFHYYLNNPFLKEFYDLMIGNNIVHYHFLLELTHQKKA